MKLIYIVNAINSTTGLERMVTVQTNYFIENYNYKIDLILLRQHENDDKSFFKLNSKITIHYLNITSKGLKRFYYKFTALNRVLNKLDTGILVVCVDDVIGLFVPYFIKNKYKTVYQRHSTKKINFFKLSNSIKTKVSNLLKKHILNLGGKSYDKFVLLSDSHRKDWKHIKNISIIGNPLILESQSKKAELNKNVVLAVGRHDYCKGFDMLLEVWSKVIKDCPNWKLRVIGKKTSSLDYRKTADDIGISNSIEFIDSTKDMISAYLDASILTCTSRTEGFPLVIIEAMSMGVPVISFDCDFGPRDIINNAIDGLLVPSNDVNAFSESLKALISDESYRKRLGHQAQINIQRFNPDMIMLKWKSLFESLA